MVILAHFDVIHEVLNIQPRYDIINNYLQAAIDVACHVARKHTLEQIKHIFPLRLNLSIVNQIWQEQSTTLNAGNRNGRLLADGTYV